MVNRQRRLILIEAVDQLGKFSALTADSVRQTRGAIVAELKDLGPVWNRSLCGAWLNHRRSIRHLSLRRTPFNEMVPAWLTQRVVQVVDVTLPVARLVTRNFSLDGA